MAKIAVIGLSGQSIFMKVNNLPTPSTTIHSTNLYIEPGGKGYNQAVACKKLGAEVSYFSKVGCDEYGNICEGDLKGITSKLDYLKDLGIKTIFEKDKILNTALATILTDDLAENEVIVYKGASSNLNVSELKDFESEIVNADVLLLQYEISIDVVKKAIEIAKGNNTLVILNPAPAIYLDKEILNMADIVTPNYEEAKTLYGLDIEKLPSSINNTLIVTLGSKGSLLINNHTSKKFSPINVEAVDTTGAGDIFNAGLAVAIANKKSIEEAIEFATVASGLSVTKEHVMDSIPTKEMVEEYLKRH